MRVSVTVKPGSSKGPLVEKTEQGYLVYLAERPIDGQANAALERLLAVYFKVPKSSVSVVKGLKSRIKQVDIAD
ncbi:MAG: DUF167 domain-containing protein [Microbacteriaceae bacterium]